MILSQDDMAALYAVVTVMIIFGVIYLYACHDMRKEKIKRTIRKEKERQEDIEKEKQYQAALVTADEFSVDLEVIKEDPPAGLDGKRQNFYYGGDRTCNMKFHRDSGNPMYVIEWVKGSYTKSEIEKIIKIVGGNPRAVKERLLGKEL